MNCNDLIVVRQKDGSFKCCPFTIRLTKKVARRESIIVVVNGKRTGIELTINEGEDTPYFPKNVTSFYEKFHLSESKKKTANIESVANKSSSKKQKRRIVTRDVVHEMMKESVEYLKEMKKRDDRELNKEEEEEEYGEFERIHLGDLVKQNISQAFFPLDLITPKEEDLFELMKDYDNKSVILKVTFFIKSSPNIKTTNELYIYNHDDKIIVSDIDGTITKSDIRGFISTVVFNYHIWTQKNVCSYFQTISKNNYKFVYLSARALNIFDQTKRYLIGVNQQDLKLPKGPAFCVMKNKLRAIAVVVDKSEDLFKIEFLKSIQNLFSENPFIAGFGNTSRDLKTYQFLEMKMCFIINKKGVVDCYYCKNTIAQKKSTFNQGYVELELKRNIDSMFPFLLKKNKEEEEEGEEEEKI